MKLSHWSDIRHLKMPGPVFFCFRHLHPVAVYPVTMASGAHTLSSDPSGRYTYRTGAVAVCINHPVSCQLVGGSHNFTAPSIPIKFWRPLICLYKKYVISLIVHALLLSSAASPVKSSLVSESPPDSDSRGLSSSFLIPASAAYFHCSADQFFYILYSVRSIYARIPPTVSTVAYGLWKIGCSNGYSRSTCQNKLQSIRCNGNTAHSNIGSLTAIAA